MTWKIYTFVDVLQAVSVETLSQVKCRQKSLLISLIILGVVEIWIVLYCDNQPDSNVQ